MYKKKDKIKGYHGTYLVHKDSILENNFSESPNKGIWIGEGVYFFVDGISVDTPAECAMKWALDEAARKANEDGTTDAIVLEAEIGVIEDKFLDLSIPTGMKLFNQFRQQAIEEIEKSGKRVIGKYKDTDVLKVMRDALNIEFVKAEVYIRLGILRKEEMASRLPNVTIFAVNNPKKNIYKHSINEVLRRAII